MSAKQNKKILIPLLHLLLSGCNPLAYEPEVVGDSPSSPATPWQTRPFKLAEPAPLPFTAEDLSSTMPLSKLLDIALFNNPSTRASWNAARAAAFGVQVSKSLYYPAIAYTGTLNAENSTIGLASGTNNSTAQGNAISNIGQAANTSGTTVSGTALSPDIYTSFNELTANYLVLDFGGRDAKVELARQTLYAANWEHNFTMQQVMLSVLTNYTSYIGNKGLVEADIQDLHDAEVALQAAKKMHAAGLTTMTDVLQALSAVEMAKLNLIQAQSAEKTSFAEMLIAIGLPPDTDVSVEQLPQKLPVIEVEGNVSTLFELAKQKRPDIGAAIAAVQEQQADFKIAYSSGLPTLSLNGVLSKLHYFRTPIRDGHDNSISLEVNFPVFQGFFYINQEKQIRAQVQEALANLDVQIATVAIQVVTNYYAYVSAVAALPSAEALLDYSQRAYKGLLLQYKTGTSSILDVLTALTTLSNARAQLVVTRTQWAASLANLAFSVGILGDTSGYWGDAPTGKLTYSATKDVIRDNEKP